MARKVIILDVARPDFREIKIYGKNKFGDDVSAEVNKEFKQAISLIGDNPETGTQLDELAFLGFNHFRKMLVRQTRLIYGIRRS